MCARLYTLGPDGKPIETSSAGPPLQLVHSQFSSSPNSTPDPKLSNDGPVESESSGKKLGQEVENNHLGLQESSSVSRAEGVIVTRHNLPRSSPLEQAFPYGIGVPTSASDEGVGNSSGNSVNRAQEPRPRLRLGMMGVGGYRASKDEMGWTGPWPSLYGQPNQGGNNSTPAPNSTNGCCSSKPITGQSLPPSQPISCSNHREPLDGSSHTSSHSVNAVSYPSCQNCHSDHQPTRPNYSQVSLNGPMAPKSAPFLVYQHPHTVYPQHLDVGQTTLFTIPPSYATASHPLTLQQLAYLQQNPHLYSQTVPQHAPFGIIGQAAPPAEGVTMFSHDCNCGAACQCLGCAAHPFNATTRSHVQSLGAIIAHDYHDSTAHSHPQSGYDTAPDNFLELHNMAGVVPQCCNPNISANTSDPTLSTITQPGWTSPTPNNPEDQQIPFQSSEYYTMEIPMDPLDPQNSCTDVSGSCQCGDDCACIGCLTHTGHDGIPLDV